MDRASGTWAWGISLDPSETLIGTKKFLDVYKKSINVFHKRVARLKPYSECDKLQHVNHHQDVIQQDYLIIYFSIFI